MSEPLEDAPPGYLSERSKRRFTITAGLLGGGFFVLQFIVPFVVMIAVMPTFIFNSNLFRFARVGDGVSWNDALWYVERTGGLPSESQSEHLARLPLNAEAEPERIVEISLDDPDLLADGDRLWLITAEGVAQYEAGAYRKLETRAVLGDISAPFLYEGAPAVIEKAPNELRVLVFREGEWENRAPISIPEIAKTSLECCLRVWSRGPEVHVFYRSGQTVFHHRGLPAEGEKWTPIGRAPHGFRVGSVDARPAVFLLGGHGFEKTVSGFRWRDGAWEDLVSLDIPGASSFGVIEAHGQDRYALVSQSVPSSFVVRQMRGDELLSKVSIGGSFPFPAPLMPVMFLPHLLMMTAPLILALILSSLMRKHRVCEYRAGDASADFASVWRRAIAQVVDALVAGLPAGIFLIVVMGPRFSDAEAVASPAQVFAIFAWVFAWLGWAVVVLLVYSFMEGRWGASPGKWLLGIRVLDARDLAPCGFGRGVIRNLLKPIDGFFNFMVGIMLVALTESWQRLGDLAARTVVVRTNAREPGAEELRGLR